MYVTAVIKACETDLREKETNTSCRHSLSEELFERMVKRMELVKRNTERKRKRKRKMQGPACLVKRAAGRAEMEKAFLLKGHLHLHSEKVALGPWAV